MTSDKPIDTTAAEAYEQHMVPGMFLRWAQIFVERAAPRPGEYVLDVACGTGIGARLAAAQVGPTGKVVGLDVDPGVIEVARRISGDSTTPMEWHCASALEMPFENGSFDLVLCLQGLQFFPDRLKGFAEIHRVLKPSGRLVASLWGPLESNKGHHAVVQALERQQADAAPAKRACSFSNPEDIRRTAEQAGFAKIEIKTEDGVSQFASLQSFLDGMTRGSPSTRHAVAKLSADARERFVHDVREALAPCVVGGGVLAYPMRTHVLTAHA
jgi:ubiquinone/menaquinone biosynthesis C-methylase UbiE